MAVACALCRRLIDLNLRFSCKLARKRILKWNLNLGSVLSSYRYIFYTFWQADWILVSTSAVPESSFETYYRRCGWK